MNQTEAFEAVYQAAVERLSHFTARRQDKQRATLERALNKVFPRVQRMRQRLDFIRAKRAGTLNRPSWATP